MWTLNTLTDLRRALHAQPEVSGNERATAALIEARLRALQPDELLTGLGGHGVLATFDSGLPGPALLFRCELDALPIMEANDIAHRSQIAGVSHKCGHDGHMAILAGLADSLAAQRPARGKVHLLFQPAEETGAGAQAVLDDPRFDSIKPDVGYALHNFPGLPKHAIVVKNGVFTAAVGSLILRFDGRTSHASEPEHGLNPSLAIAAFLQACEALILNDPAAAEFRLITTVHVRIGSPAYGVSAGDGEVHLTLRAWDDTRLAQLYVDVIGYAQRLGAQHGLRVSNQPLQRFYANNNDAQATDRVRQAARANDLPLIELSNGFKGGEDFGLFTARFPCAMFGLGAGEHTPALHSPDYDFPDAIIASGVRMFEALVRQAT